MPRFEGAVKRRRKCDAMKRMKLGGETLADGRQSRCKDSWELYRRVGGTAMLWGWGYDDFVLAGQVFECHILREKVRVVIEPELGCLIERSRWPGMRCHCDDLKSGITTLKAIAEEYHEIQDLL